MDFFSVKNKTKTSADLYFYGDIVSSWWGAWDDTDQYPENVRNFLDDVKDVPNLNIYINSGGGAVFAGMAIYNMLKRHKAYKTVYVDGLAASIASIIALAGDKIIIPANAFLMIHRPYGGAKGNAEEIRGVAELLEKIEDAILDIYSENAVDGVTKDAIKDMMYKEKWFTGSEAAKVFNIEVSAARDIAAHIDGDAIKNYKNKPPLLSEQQEKSKTKSALAETEKAKLKLLCEV